MRTILSVCLAILLGAGAAAAQVPEGPDAGPLASWRDGEMRARYLEDRDETEVDLALLPVDPRAGEPRLTLNFGASFRGRTPTVAPGAVILRINVSPLVDPNLIRDTTVTFTLDRGTERERGFALSGRRPDTAGYRLAPGDRIDTMLVRIPFGLTLLALAQAETVSGVAFEVFPFELSDQQLAALQGFIDLIVPPGQS